MLYKLLHYFLIMYIILECRTIEYNNNGNSCIASHEVTGPTTDENFCAIYWLYNIWSSSVNKLLYCQRNIIADKFKFCFATSEQLYINFYFTHNDNDDDDDKCAYDLQ